MSTFHERLHLAYRLENERRAASGAKRLTYTEIWKAADATSGAATHWFSGANAMDLDTCIKASMPLGCNPFWLFDESQPMTAGILGAGGVSPSSNTNAAVVLEQSTPPLINLSEHPDLREVPRVKFKLSAGVSGYAIEAEEGNGKPVFFRRDWFELNGYRPEKLFAVRVSGASMEPALWDGDLVVINTSDTTPHDGDAFALNYEGEMVIKRMRRDAGEWWATSDNADQRRFAPKRCTEDVKVIGRVVYKQSERI